jgi:hypothetical protein
MLKPMIKKLNDDWVKFVENPYCLHDELSKIDIKTDQ